MARLALRRPAPRACLIPQNEKGDPRGVPLHREFVAELANLAHRDGEVFRRPDGAPYERPRGDYDRSGGSAIKTAFKAALRRAGIKNFRVHDCIHCWATWYHAAHHDLIALQRLGGWRTLAMVTRYTHANVEACQKGID